MIRERTRFYHGTRADLKPGDVIEPCDSPEVGEPGSTARYVYWAPDLDAAIWAAELSDGEDRGRVYVVQPIGAIRKLPGRKIANHPTMSYRSREPLRVVDEVTAWTFYHGTRADLRPGDLIEPGYASNFGKRNKAAHVHLTATLDAATWGAELAVGEGPGRIYIVEPTGPIENDPDLTNRRFRGNPTKSYRSLQPLRVTGEITNWRGHSPEALKVMKDRVERLERLAVEQSRD